MGQRRQRREADVLVGVISWQGSDAAAAEADAERPDADVVLLEPYRLTRRRRTAAPPRRA
ncbi:hypothetical protein [Sporichthya polymorpha]|uniref:hypothetical protein n=1 Tax=Sporichthya polymorpha TaxID=35751 RepID=UPI0003A28A0E|nr:hypothetical protein [Sporichthya polymorpha]